MHKDGKTKNQANPIRAGPARQCSGRTAVVWALAIFLGGQLVLNAVVDCWWMAARDARHGPWFAAKLQRLQASSALHPHRSLVLMLVPSLTTNGFRGNPLNQATTAPGEPILAFNFGIPGTSTIKQAFLWKYLRERGVRPDLLLLEISPRHLF